MACLRASVARSLHPAPRTASSSNQRLTVQASALRSAAQRTAQAGAAATLAAALALGGLPLAPPPALAQQDTAADSRQELVVKDAQLASLAGAPPAVVLPPAGGEHPILDGARLIPRGQLEGLEAQLRSLERESGWKVRLLSQVGRPSDQRIDDVRRGWAVDGRTVVILADPTSPNLFTIKYGQDVNAILPQRFFSELQTRFGNMYYIRDNGEGKAVTGLLDALETCLRKGGCNVVPGLIDDQYYLTLWTTVTGGLIFGATSRIEPQGWVQRRWVWPLLFSPLWGTLFISFGLGPILSRTDDPLPIVQNCLAFAVAAAAVVLAPGLAQHTGMQPWNPNEDDAGGST